MRGTKFDRFIETNPGISLPWAAIDQHDQQNSRLCTNIGGKYLEFLIRDLPEFVRDNGRRLVNGLGLECASFPFYRNDKVLFLKACEDATVLVFDTATNAVARYRAEHGLEKDKTVTDAKILCILREEKPFIWKSFKNYRPDESVMHIDAEMGRTVVGFRASNKEDSYDPAWANGYPSPDKVLLQAEGHTWAKSLPEIFSLLVQDGSYHPMFLPFFLLASRCVSEGLSKKQYEQIARMSNFRYKGKNQSSGERGSGSIFASLNYHEIVRGEVNKTLGLSHLAGIPKQLEAIGGSKKSALKSLKELYHSKRNLARKCVRYIWHRAEEMAS